MTRLYCYCLSFVGLHCFVLVSTAHVEWSFKLISDANLLSPDSTSFLCMKTREQIMQCCLQCINSPICSTVVLTGSNCYCSGSLSPNITSSDGDKKIFIKKQPKECTHPSYLLINGWCFKRSSTDRTWPDAMLDCQADGGHLVVLDSPQKTAAVVYILARYYPLPPDMDAYFVGASDLQQEGEWKWVKDSAENNFTWKATQPNNEELGFPGKDADCASVRISQEKLRDDYCENPRPYVCEID